MKKKSRSIQRTTKRESGKALLDQNTFFILTCVVVALLVVFGAQTGTLPKLW